MAGLGLAALFFFCASVPAEGFSTTLRILFLGDQDLHHPAERFSILQPALAPRGIELTYTERLSDLSPTILSRYDGIIIYANHAAIQPDQEKALLDYVSAGHGLVAVHSASYCFLNSPSYLSLIGGQFKSHGSGEFQERYVDSQVEHPILKGLKPIESWDETYVHTKLGPDRVLLSERVEGDRVEPWTWVRSQGKGRVFYTAWGHDHRTWNNAGFQALIEHAIHWAVAGVKPELTARPGLPPLAFTNAPSPIPSYVWGAQWGTLGASIQQMQLPLSPEDSARRVVTREGFESRLFAAEPDITKPICMTWDSRGRLWIAETVDYPNELQTPGKGHDRIRICEDTDGDGKADKFTVFAEGLSIPTGMVIARGGLIIAEAGRTVFLKDTDGDDRADVRQVLFEGWGMGDTHATASNLRVGLDNWIWGTVGYSGFDGTVGGRKVKFGMGVFRFKPDGSALEFIRSSNNNTWGLGFSEEGIVFGSTANNNASWYMPIPNRYYEAVHGWSASRMETIGDSQLVFPITEKVRQVDFHGRYTAAAGHALYTARSFPRSYWNQVAFVTEPTAHLIGMYRLEGHGADFSAYNERSFLASDDEWTAPIMAEVGPDGAVWVLDWYNYIVQHNPTPSGFKTGRGNAYETPLRDKRHGRIYRVSWKGGQEAKAPTFPKLDPLDPSPRGLVDALQNDNLFWRLHAQRLLVERGRPDVLPLLSALVRGKELDALGLSPGALHALWALHGLGALDAAHPDSEALEVATAAIRHPAAAVRRAALTVLPRTAATRDALFGAGSLMDADAQVRMAAFLAVSELPASPETGPALLKAISRQANRDDRWIIHAATAAAAAHDSGFLSAILAMPKDPKTDATMSPGLRGLLKTVAGHYAHRAPTDSVLATLSQLRAASGSTAIAFLDGLAAGWPEKKAPTIDAAAIARIQELMDGLPDEAIGAVLLLLDRWGSREAFKARADQLSARLQGRVADASLSTEQRIDSARRLVQLMDSSETSRAILKPIDVLSQPALMTGLLNVVGESRQVGSAKAVLEAWPRLTPGGRRTASNALLRRPEWALVLLDTIESKELQRSDLAKDQWTQLRNSPDNRVSTRAKALSDASATATASQMDETVKRLLPVAQRKGDVVKGQQLFETTCAICHVFNGKGARVGPDLTGISARPKADVLVDIVDPNRSVESNYRLWSVTTRDGETLGGRLDSETATSIDLLDTTGQKHTLQRKDIARLEASNLSIMPVGFDQLPPDDLAAILEYMATSVAH